MSTILIRGVERRVIQLGAGEIRAKKSGDVTRLTGYAAKFNVLSRDLGGFKEKINPGAFGASLRDGADVRFLFNHSADVVLGRTASKTLEIGEDSTGLWFDGKMPNTGAARDLVELIDRGDVSEMSFGFRTIKDDWEMMGGMPVRTLHAVDLFDVSVVTFAAYPETDVATRGLQEFVKKTAKPEGTPALDTRVRRLRAMDAV